MYFCESLPTQLTRLCGRAGAAVPGTWCAGRECSYESHCRHNLHGFVVGRVLLCLARGVQVGSRECTFVSHRQHNLHGLWKGEFYLFGLFKFSRVC